MALHRDLCWSLCCSSVIRGLWRVANTEVKVHDGDTESYRVVETRANCG